MILLQPRIVITIRVKQSVFFIKNNWSFCKLWNGNFWYRIASLMYICNRMFNIVKVQMWLFFAFILRPQESNKDILSHGLVRRRSFVHLSDMKTQKSSSVNFRSACAIATVWAECLSSFCARHTWHKSIYPRIRIWYENRIRHYVWCMVLGGYTLGDSSPSLSFSASMLEFFRAPYIDAPVVLNLAPPKTYESAV